MVTRICVLPEPLTAIYGVGVCPIECMARLSAESVCTATNYMFIPSAAPSAVTW